MEKPDNPWSDLKIEYLVEGPDDLGFYAVAVSHKNLETTGQSRCPIRATAYALKELAETMVTLSVHSRGWT